MPKIPGVELSFLGCISGTEFVSIISDDAKDNIIGSIFDDNVRDWQDWNGVNSKMKETLESTNKTRFVLMNNGVTIIAKDVKHVGSDFTIEDFQIVNGCQTSHVIFDQRMSLDPSVMIPLRLVWTKDDSVIESITLATNSQTALKPEQLLALTEYSKKLETFFSSFDDGQRLYYERRDGQYDRQPVFKNLIIHPKVLIRAYAAMFLDEPHTATRNYKSLRDRVGKDIFRSNDKLEMYYVAAFAIYRLEQQYNGQKIKAIYKSARHHILLAVRLLLDPGKLAFPNSAEMGKRCMAMMETLWDQERTDKLFQEATAAIDAVSASLDRDHIRTQAITQAIIDKFSVIR